MLPSLGLSTRGPRRSMLLVKHHPGLWRRSHGPKKGRRVRLRLTPPGEPRAGSPARRRDGTEKFQTPPSDEQAFNMYEVVTSLLYHRRVLLDSDVSFFRVYFSSPGIGKYRPAREVCCYCNGILCRGSSGLSITPVTRLPARNHHRSATRKTSACSQPLFLAREMKTAGRNGRREKGIQSATIILIGNGDENRACSLKCFEMC